jgi:hypothetical protein
LAFIFRLTRDHSRLLGDHALAHVNTMDTIIAADAL